MIKKAELAFYDLGLMMLLQKLWETKSLRKQIETIKNSTTIDWSSREDIKANIGVQVKRLLRNDKQKEAIETVMEQAELMCDNQGEF